MHATARASLFAAALAGLAALPAVALANGRLPGPTNLRFHASNPDRWLVGATIGLLTTSDNGATVSWVCENAVGYGGEYDPDYELHPTRDEVWATTFEGLRVSKDGGCTWTSIGSPIPSGTWIGEVQIGPDGRIWAATSSGKSANDVYVSTDGMTFASAGLLDRTGWWESVRIDPADGDHVWISGYRTAPVEEGYLKRTTNGGTDWVDVPLTGIVFGMDPRMMMLAVSGEVAFVRVLNAGEPLGDAIYRTDDAGASWTKVLQLGNFMRGFAISADGMTVYAGTTKLCADDAPTFPDGGLVQKGCLFKSTDGGVTFEKAGYHPRLGAEPTPNTSNALAFGLDGALYAAGSNGIDGWLVGKSTDGAESFTKVIGLTDIDAPLSCGGDTAQAECAALVWPSLCVQSFICPDTRPDAAPVDGDADAGNGGGGGGGGGCCAVAPTPAQFAAAALLALLVGLVVARRRS